MNFRYLPDIAIADIAFEATGKTLEEVFAESGLAVTDITVDLTTVEEKTTKEFSLEHEELARLLFDFLEELVFLKDTDGFLAKRFEVKIEENEKNYKLTAKVHGEEIDREKHALKADIKAITMHMFNIEKTKEGYKTLVVVDI